MKKLLAILLIGLIISPAFGQVPGSFNYQAIVRDASGNVKANTTTTIDISILQGSTTGSSVYAESNNVTTNSFGLVTLQIGSKNPTQFALIDWSTGVFFIKVTVGGVEMGTSQLLSVPYALYAKTSGTPGLKGDQGIQGEKGDKGDTGVQGLKGDKGDTGSQGLKGIKGDTGVTGATGKSAYLSWLGLGNTGTEADFIASLKASGGSGSGASIKDSIIATDKTWSSSKINSELTKKAKQSDLEELIAKFNKINNTVSAGGTISDVDGNVYNTVKIGTQTWMAENLKTTKYNDGVAIPTKGGDVTSEINNPVGTYPKYQWSFNADNANVPTYGRLYTWWTATDSRICPVGWHVPTDAEIATLWTNLGADTTVGGKLKEADTLHWNTPNLGATNSSGFTALPAGFRSYGNYEGLGTLTYFWTTTPDGSDVNMAVYYSLNKNSGYMAREIWRKVFGRSIRCVKD